jgi:hypothetical protein
MIPLCANGRLEISLEQGQDSEWVTLSLSSNTASVLIRCEVDQTTANRSYHRKEAIVIGLRRLVSDAVDQGLISLAGGVWGATEPALSRFEWGL